MALVNRRTLLAQAGAGALALTLPLSELEQAAAELEARLALSPSALRALRAAVRGPVLTPRSRGYGNARLVYNERFDGIRPAAVVQPLDARDVAAVVRWADRYNVNPVAKSGGHSYAGYSTSRGVVIDLRRLSGIRLNPGRGTATIGPAAQLIDVYAALARRGVTVPAGSCPSVCVGGLALGGGHGLAGRRFGLTSDNLRSVQIVTADGRIRQVDASSDEDLFWACRGGGGGNFGVVTGLTLRVHRVHSATWFFLSWPWSQASAALAAWQRFAPEAPDALTSIFHLSTGGADPDVSTSGQFFGSPRQLRALLAPLLRVSGASLSAGNSRYLSLMLRWAGCLGDPLRQCHTVGTRPGGRLERMAFYAKSDYVNTPLPARARATMVNWIEARQRQGRGSGALLLDSYGGAINSVDPDATAFVHRDQLFSIQYLAYPSGRGGGGASSSWLSGVYGALRPYVSGQAYQNYIDPNLKGWGRAYYADNWGRLRAVKQQYDPDFRFRFRQAIPPAS